MRLLRTPRAALALLAVAAVCLAPEARSLRAQTAPAPARPDPSAAPVAALADTLQEACLQNATAFAAHLTAESAAAFRSLPPEQQIALLKRFVLLDDPGKPLLSSDGQGHTVLRCEAEGVISELRFGAAQVHDNLAFIPVEVPQAGEKGRSARFGLVREDGQWKLLSLGLLLLDVPELARQWEHDDLGARESRAVQSLRTIAEALGSYREAFGQLPESLAQLGPPAQDGKSPEKAGLLDASLAGGEDAGYRFRYSLVPAATGAEESDRDKLAGFQLAATPVGYGKDGRKSFYLDSGGVLRGADKGGAVATADDPRIGGAQP